MMRVAVLGSGSGGNAVVVESGGHRLLIDAGFSCRQLEERLAVLDEQAARLDALLLTHEHQDHCRGVATLVRRYPLPVYATAGTFQGIRWRAARGAGKSAPELHTVRSGAPFEVPCRGARREGVFRVEAFTLPHDAREPVGFVVEDEQGARLGLVADLGARTQLAWGRLRDLDCLVLETNHDLHMLRTGPYPWHLKQRVASRHGHLSNDEAAAGACELVSERLRSVVLYHLSRTNNLPALAARAVGERLEAVGCTAEIVVTGQDQITPWIEVAAPAQRPAVAAAPSRPTAPHQFELW